MNRVWTLRWLRTRLGIGALALVVAGLVTVTTERSAEAAVPLKTPVQGMLRDNAGALVESGSFSVDFALYPTEEGVDAVWSESWPKEGGDCSAAEPPAGCVKVVGGVFEVMLGSHTDLDPAVFRANDELWLGMKVETDDELPRRRLGTNAFSFHAATADVAGAVDCTGCIPTEALSFDLCGQVASCGGIVTIDADGLPADGLDEVSSGALTNEFDVGVTAGAPPVDVEAFTSGNVTIAMDEPEVLRALSVSIEVTGVEGTDLKLELFPPNGASAIVLHDAGPGDAGGLNRSWPPTPEVSGELAALLGTNPTGTWLLRVNNLAAAGSGLVATVESFRIEYTVLRANRVRVTGDLVVEGDTFLGVAAAGDACGADQAGALRYQPGSTSLLICDGTVMRHMDCRCELAAVSCGAVVVDSCGGVCAATGTGLDLAQCPPAASVACGEPVRDPCGNICGGTGTLAGSCGVGSTCDTGVCHYLRSCKAARDSGVTTDGLRVIDPDGLGGSPPFEVYCGMSFDGGGWTLVARIVSSSSSAHADPGPVGSLWSPIQPAVAKLSDSVINTLRAPFGDTVVRFACGDNVSYFQEETKAFQANVGGSAALMGCSTTPEGPFQGSGGAGETGYPGINSWSGSAGCAPVIYAGSGGCFGGSSWGESGSVWVR